MDSQKAFLGLVTSTLYKINSSREFYRSLGFKEEYVLQQRRVTETTRLLCSLGMVAEDKQGHRRRRHD